MYFNSLLGGGLEENTSEKIKCKAAIDTTESIQKSEIMGRTCKDTHKLEMHPSPFSWPILISDFLQV